MNLNRCQTNHFFLCCKIKDNIRQTAEKEQSIVDKRNTLNLFNKQNFQQ